MNLKLFITANLLVISVIMTGQSEPVNVTNKLGKKQGHWIKKYPDKSIMYDGYFKDDHPVGELKRYYEDQTLKSVLSYSDDGRKAVAVIYHPNGYVSARGTYINQKKEGKWQFYSSFKKNCLVSEEYYSDDLKNGLSQKFYSDSTVAEKTSYVNDIKQGEWIQYYPSGVLSLKSAYLNGKVNGKFEVWFENGRIEFSGQYKDDSRDGLWIIYKNDGTIKYKLTYQSGISNDRKMEIDESDFLDSLERNEGKIADPEKSGKI